MQIVDLLPGDEHTLRQAAALLVEGFKEHWPDANGFGKPDSLMAKRVGGQDNDLSREINHE